MPDINFTLIASLRKPAKIDPRTVNLIGRKFGRLTPLGLLGFATHGAVWLCRCNCGAFSTPLGTKLLNDKTVSCACYRRNRLGDENRTHGETKTRLYRLYTDMHTRCYNPHSKAWGDYGGRGIKVCERWHKFENFRDDVGQPPSPEHQIDRYPDNNGNYEPDNFRWATRTEQARNKRNNRLATYNNETKCVAEWSEISGLGKSVITDALNRGETLEYLFNNPTRDEKRARLLTANGETHRIFEWALIRNIPSYKIRRNLDRHGQTPEEALGFEELNY